MAIVSFGSFSNLPITDHQHCDFLHRILDHARCGNGEIVPRACRARVYAHEHVLQNVNGLISFLVALLLAAVLFTARWRAEAHACFVLACFNAVSALPISTLVTTDTPADMMPAAAGRKQAICGVKTQHRMCAKESRHR